jgi:hypothetical protein
MDIKKLFIGTIAGAVVFFFLGWLVYDKLLFDFMRHNPGEKGLIGRTDIKFVYLIAGQLFYGLLLAYVLVKSNVSGLAGGLITGAVVGFFMAAAIDLTIYGTSIIMSKKGMAADIVAATVISAIAGAVIGAVAGGKKA